MSLTEQSRKDFKRISTNAQQFGQSVTMTDVAANSLTLNGLYTRHHTDFDAEGRRINTTRASVTVSLEVLDENYYDYFSPNDETVITFKNHRVDTPDGYKYKVREWYPDETMKLVTLILEQFV